MTIYKSNKDKIINHDDINGSSGLLIDWNGCIALGGNILHGALRFISYYKDNIVIVSNNSTDLPWNFVNLLKDKGIIFPEERIILAGLETIRHAIKLGIKRIMLFGRQRFKSPGPQYGA